MKEGKALKVGEGGVYSIAKEGGKEGSKIVYYVTPRGKTAGEGQVVKIIKPQVVPEGAVKVVVKKATEVEPEIVWTVKEPGKEGKEGAVWVTKEFSGKPVEGAWMSKGGQAFAFSPARDKELLEKVRAIQEQVAAVKDKKLDFTALEKSLEKLEAELAANAEKLNGLKMKFEKAPGEITVIKKIDEGEAKGDVFVYEKIRGDKSEGAATVWVAKTDESAATVKVDVSTGDHSIQIVLSGIEGGEGRSTYPLGVAAVDRLKKVLPEGYKILESKYDKEAGTMTFKIAPPEGAKVDEKLVRKIVDSVKSEFKAKK